MTAPQFEPDLPVAYLARISKIGKDDNKKDREITERLAAQDNKVLEFIKENNLYLDDKFHYQEVGSAYSRPIDKRDTLQKIMNDAKNGSFKILFIFDVSRFDRNDEVRAIYFIRELLEAGVWVFSYTDGWLDVEDDTNRLVLYIRLYNARNASKDTSRRVKAKFEAKLKAADGDRAKANLGGIAPTTFSVAQEANARTWRAEGRSYQEIADLLGAPFTEYVVRMRLQGK